jgi:putative flippase GtrA
MLALLRQFMRFSGVGAVSAIGHYGLMIVLVQSFQVGAVAASIAGSLLGAVINYCLNYRFTFHSNKRHRESVTKFAAVALTSVLVNSIFMWVGVDLMEAPYLLSQLVTTVLLLLWSFSANRLWTFRTHAKPK